MLSWPSCDVMLSLRDDVSLNVSAASVRSCPGGIFQQSRLRTWSERGNKSTIIDGGVLIGLKITTTACHALVTW